MKKFMFTLIAMFTIVASARAMSYEQARNEALFLTDKMAYELNLSDLQYEAAYEINLDYLMCVASQHDVFGPYWERRNIDMSYVLYQWQWDMFCAAHYFYRPLYWDAGYWHFRIYARYPHRDYFYFGRPHFYASYRGGHSWRNNGGRSYYEGRRDHFRPAPSRDRHSGMRDSYDRGDYRGNRSAGSSTRHVPGGADRRDAQQGSRDRGGYDNNRRSQGNYDSGSRQQGSSRGSQGSYGGSRSQGSRQQSGAAPRQQGSSNRNNQGTTRSSGGSRQQGGGASQGRAGGSRR